jgi:putative flavoprotein involved in K+ transport
VVGGSATGVQLAEEIRRSGRPVTLALGEHVRLPRMYRGRDILWWMDAAGVLDERYDEIEDLPRARHVPSPQLVGTPARTSVDVNGLQANGVRIVGRLSAIQDGVAQFSGSLRNQCTLADLKMNRLLDELDLWCIEAGLDDEVPPPHRFEPTQIAATPPLELDLRTGEFGTIVWACGYRADHTWVQLPVFDRHGRVRHDGGVVTDAPGLYLLGAKLLRRRRSTYICGAEQDTLDLSEHLNGYLDGSAAASATRASSPTALPAAALS